MEITEVSVSLMDDEKLKAFANIVIDDLFVVRGLKII
jgi:DNA-binding cell septation regulator SpoVG